jgi:alpha-beta hydrolase superfamily lysophospholipase
MQDYFFFRPEILPKSFQYRYPFPFDEVHFEMEDGGYINGIHFKVPNAKGVIYYLKGNSKSVKGWGKFAKDFVSKGYSFFMVDYRGFGKSSGKRTEATLYNDAQHVYKWLSSQYQEDEIVIYGRSLGSGIATRIASWNKPKMLILDSPYFSFNYQIRRYAFLLPLKWLLKYQIRSDQFIKKVSCPVFIVHGKKDRLIPYNQSEMLKKQIPSNIELFSVEEAHHNNLPEFPEYHEWLYDILNDEQLFMEWSKRLSPAA